MKKGRNVRTDRKISLGLAGFMLLLLTFSAPATTRYVDVNSASPTPPYTSWPTAATNIQDAIDASIAGDVISVTNGVYATGGKAMVSDLTNRVVLDKALTVVSVNGYSATIIQGAWDPTTTNGPLAVRCAWLTNGATLKGFTLRGGATRAPDNSIVEELQAGGGAWCSSLSALITQCRITNSAARYGGGVSRGSLDRCILVGNTAASNGGGAYFSALTNSLIMANFANTFGGGAYSVYIYNCTITFNKAVVSQSSGIYNSGFGVVRNSILYNNQWPFQYNYFGGGGVSQPTYSCIYPSISGTGNISSDPQLLQVDGGYIAVTSPCRGNGSAAVATGFDIDGESWDSPPSMGCDEPLESGLIGPLAVNAIAYGSETLPGRTLCFGGQVIGRASRVAWFYGDGTYLTNASYLSTCHAWTNSGDYTVTFTAYNTDNPGGVSSNMIVHILPLQVPVLTAGGLVGTNFSLQFGGQSNANYFVEYATNLASPITWLSLKSLTSTGGVVQITDTAATNAARFYRVRAQ